MSAQMPASPGFLRATALCGVFGAATMFAGDQLLFGHFGSAGDWDEGARRTIASASTLRLWLAGIAAPVAAIGYVIAALHVHARLERAGGPLRLAAATLFAALGVFACAVHAVWGAYALAMRAALAEPALEPVRLELRAYLDQLYFGAEVVGYPAGLLLALLVLAGRSSLPRWTVVCNPLLVYALGERLVQWVPAPLGAVLAGGVFNLGFLLFYVVALVTVPRRA